MRGIYIYLCFLIRKCLFIYIHIHEHEGDNRMRGIYLPTMHPPEETYPFPLTVLYTAKSGICIHTYIYIHAHTYTNVSMNIYFNIYLYMDTYI
jgi:hypothetical protein